MLAKSDISSLLALGELGDPMGIGIVPTPVGFVDSQIGGASLDIRLGRWFLSLHQSRRTQIDLSRDDEFNLEDSDGHYSFVPFEKTFVIHPGRFVLASTLEWIKLPPNIGAYITGKSSLGRRGLIIETAAGIHPGFAGCLALEISNCGEVPIAVTPGIRIAQLFFHRLDGKPQPASTSFEGMRKPVFGRYKRDVRPNRPQESLL